MQGGLSRAEPGYSSMGTHPPLVSLQVALPHRDGTHMLTHSPSSRTRHQSSRVNSRSRRRREQGSVLEREKRERRS